MKKFLLIHSYSDLNKGDAAIIISTIQNLRKEYPGCRVELQSTFSSDDQCFKDEHNELRKYADDIHTCLFPQLFWNKNGRTLYDTSSKKWSLIKYTSKNLVNYLWLRLFGSLMIATEMERRSVRAVKDCDVVISKGGSFLCSHGALREDISLARLLHPFLIAKVFEKKTIVLAQSLGPFDSDLSRRIFNFSIRYIDEFYVREHESLKLLSDNGVSIPQDKLKFCPDVAFALDSTTGKKIVNVDNSIINIGMTIVDFEFENEGLRGNYLESLRGIFKAVSERYKAHFYIFPQVLRKHPEFGTEDLRLSRKLMETIENKDNITLLESNYLSVDLAETYGDMDIFIATRLHSSIFATSKGVPALNIAYHGTKSEGTFRLLDCSDYVVRITDVQPAKMVEKTLELLEHRVAVRDKLEGNVEMIKSDIRKVFASLA